jgi:hypothetical protein
MPMHEIYLRWALRNIEANVTPPAISAEHVQELIELGLVIFENGELKLTDSGRQRRE